MVKCIGVVTLSKRYGDKFPEGFKVQVDAIKRNKESASGYMLRAINMHKRPIWFDFGWAKELEAESDAKGIH